MMQRLRQLPVLVLFGGGLFLFCIVCCFLLSFTPHGNGSPEYAERWIAILKEYPDLESARANNKEIQGRRLKNGEWWFGVCADSHASSQGGTIVIRDSKGRTRAFFGHVCGSNYFDFFFNYETLDQVDDGLGGFTQYQP